MKIKGMGSVSQKEILSVLTSDAKKSIASGHLTWKEAGEMYKLYKAKQHSVIGSMSDTFYANYNRIPEGICDKLPPEEIAALVDAFYKCYSDGNSRQ